MSIPSSTVVSTSSPPKAPRKFCAALLASPPACAPVLVPVVIERKLVASSASLPSWLISAPWSALTPAAKRMASFHQLVWRVLEIVYHRSLPTVAVISFESAASNLR